MEGISGLYSLKCQLTKESKALNDLVIVEILEQPPKRGWRGDIKIPDYARLNTELVLGKVISIGPEAKKENLFVGDHVLYDQYAAHCHPPLEKGIIIIVNVENIIVKIEDVEQFIKEHS